MLWSGPVWIWWARAMCCLSAHGLCWVLAGQRWNEGQRLRALTVFGHPSLAFEPPSRRMASGR